MKKILIKIGIGIFLILIGYFCFLYYAHYSEGIRAGELVKFSKKGMFIKTWEGQISQGVSESLQFEFSVEDNQDQVKHDLMNLQGKYLKLHYFERYKTLFWLGDSKYFVTKVEEETSLNSKKN